MLFLLTNRTRPGLSAVQYGELASLAKAFYADMPSAVKVVGEWAALDQSVNYSLIEAPDLEAMQALQAPFEPYTLTEIVPVRSISGWTAS